MSDVVVRLATRRKVVALASRFLRGAAICQGDTQRPLVALTFDDGPHPRWTPEILDILDSGGAKATFFMVGRFAQQHPDLVREIRRRGHDVGSHLYSHDRSVVFDDASFERELLQSRDELQSILGESIRWLRFPYGERGRQDPRSILRRYGLRTVHWTFSSHDGKVVRPDRIVARVEAGIRAGAIVLMHDRLADEESGLPYPYVGPRTATVEALGGILERLRRQGLTAVNLTALLPDGA